VGTASVAGEQVVDQCRVITPPVSSNVKLAR
jgi:hypothetical protein